MPGYQPVKPRVIAKKLGLPKEQASEVRRAVKRLVHQGLLIYGTNHLVMPVAGVPTVSPLRAPTERLVTGEGAGVRATELDQDSSTMKAKKSPTARRGNRIAGVFQRTQKGYGFVRPSGVESRGDRSQDVYIPADRAADAASGDTVLVELQKRRHGDPGQRGRIVEIVERQTHQFVGTYFESEGTGYVRIAGTLFARPICVGDPGAKNVQPDDKVVVEMVRFPSSFHAGEGVVTEVLGPGGRPGVDTLSIIREFGLPDRFAEDALAEAEQQAEAFDESIDGRTDFTGEVVVTIDPADARDFDDAISLEQLDNGHWRLGVHIADVSHFVRPNTALDREALDRATSVYLPDRVIPMLPEVISNGLASLQPGKVRYTKSAVIEFTAEGQRIATELHSAAIRSTKRLTYEQVDEFLAERTAGESAIFAATTPTTASRRCPRGARRENRDRPRAKSVQRKLGGKVSALLGHMHTLALILRKRRRDQGALELTMPEVKVELDRQGRVTGAHVAENTESHQIIEEFMLAANEAVAETCRDRGLHFLRRVHQAPSPEKIRALEEFMRELGYPAKHLQSRFGLQALLAAATGQPEQHAVHFAVLRSLQRAVYSPEEEGHYALASDCYCHFTSPIRRYPDLTVHRILEAMLRQTKPRTHYDELVVLGRHCSDREQRAEAAERDLTKLKLLAYLSTRLDEEMEAVVTGVESYGIFVQGIKLPAEGLIRTESLRDDYYRFDRATHTLAGHRQGNRYRLGDLLRVAVARVDLERRELDFRLVERKKGRTAGATPADKSAKQTKSARSIRRAAQLE